MYDPLQVDGKGRTNLVRMKKNGLSPIDYNGDEVHAIHHFDQKHKGPWIIVPDRFHRKNSKLLHSKPQPIEGVNHNVFRKEKRKFWREEGNKIEQELKNTGCKYE